MKAFIIAVIVASGLLILGIAIGIDATLFSQRVSYDPNTNEIICEYAGAEARHEVDFWVEEIPQP